MSKETKRVVDRRGLLVDGRGEGGWSIGTPFIPGRVPPPLSIFGSPSEYGKEETESSTWIEIAISEGQMVGNNGDILDAHWPSGGRRCQDGHTARSQWRLPRAKLIDRESISIVGVDPDSFRITSFSRISQAHSKKSCKVADLAPKAVRRERNSRPI